MHNILYGKFYTGLTKDITLTQKQIEGIETLVTTSENYKEPMLNAFYFLDLLDNESKTCKDLFETVKLGIREKVKQEPRYYNISSKRDFFNKLELVRVECTINNLKPIIHMEGHGSISGIKISRTNENVGYSELITKLREINFVTRNNLLVISPICYSLYSNLYDYEMMTCAPYYAMIAPTGETKEKNVMTLHGFYEIFLTEYNLNKAYEQIRPHYYLLACERLFLETFLKYYICCNDKKKREQRLNHLLTSMRILGHNTYRINTMRNEFKELIKETEIVFYRIKDRYLMNNTEEQRKRFDYNYEDFEYLCVDSCKRI